MIIACGFYCLARASDTVIYSRIVYIINSVCNTTECAPCMATTLVAKRACVISIVSCTHTHTHTRVCIYIHKLYKVTRNTCLRFPVKMNGGNSDGHRRVNLVSPTNCWVRLLRTYSQMTKAARDQRALTCIVWSIGNGRGRPASRQHAYTHDALIDILVHVSHRTAGMG